MAIFNSYVSLPEGMYSKSTTPTFYGFRLIIEARLQQAGVPARRATSAIAKH